MSEITTRELESLGRYMHGLSLLSTATFVGLPLNDRKLSVTAFIFLVAATILLVQGLHFFRAAKIKEDKERRESWVSTLLWLGWF